MMLWGSLCMVMPRAHEVADHVDFCCLWGGHCKYLFIHFCVDFFNRKGGSQAFLRAKITPLTTIGLGARRDSSSLSSWLRVSTTILNS